MSHLHADFRRLELITFTYVKSVPTEARGLGRNSLEKTVLKRTPEGDTSRIEAKQKGVDSSNISRRLDFTEIYQAFKYIEY